MSNPKYILALDQGTTSSRAVIFDHKGRVVNIAQKEFRQIYPKPGLVEHDPMDIWASQISVTSDVLTKANIKSSQIAAIGITNQRETTIVWDRHTGKPIHNAIVWQDRRTSSICDALHKKGYADKIKSKTGLVLDAYFSGTKIQWLLDNVPEARQKAEKGELAFGTVDSWLVWQLTRGETHITDITNASRTLLYNIHDLTWDKDLLDIFNIPESLLPEVKSSSEVYAETAKDILNEKIPIAGIAGDQQAALFGQMCLEKGMVKNTYGTGCFMVLNTGEEVVDSQNNLLSTVAWQIDGKVTYALEGSVFVGGAIIQWLRDGLGILKDSSESEDLAQSVEDNGGVYFVPALTGLGAPHWDQYARGGILGITRGTEAGHIVRAAIEGIAFQVKDVLDAMIADTGVRPEELRVDGGAVANGLLMQFQADIFNFEVTRPEVLETTALGAAYLAGLAVKYWEGTDELKDQWRIDKVFRAKMSKGEVDSLLKTWKKAVERVKDWEK